MSDSKRREYHGIQIHEKDPSYVNALSSALVSKFYAKGATFAETLARPAIAFCAGDLDLAQRIYDYAYKNWFMYASPVLSNAPTGYWKFSRESGKPVFHTETPAAGMPISCFALDIPDTIDGQIAAMQEVGLLSVAGGGVGAHNSIRAVTNKAPGPIPYMKVLDSTIGYFKQGSTRKGAIAMYMDADHPDIEEHIRFRVPGGDPARRSDNRKQFHCGFNTTDAFEEAVRKGTDFDLKCPHTGEVRETVSARKLWEDVIETRALTGEPYIFRKDMANRFLPEVQKRKGLKIKGSNLCSEISLATDETRTFVCCLSSLNLEWYEQWKDSYIVQDLIRFLDNVLQYFIENAPEGLAKAKYSAQAERALGLGAFGWHAFLQSKSIPFESGGVNSAVQYSNIIFSKIKERAVEESRKLAAERGEPEDMIGTGLRNSHLLAIAPNANSADIANTSPSVEPAYRNCFVKDTRAGAFTVKNKYLEAVLANYQKNTQEVWKSIQDNDGSVQHLDFLTEHEKKVFRTAFEMDQHWLVEQADQRGQFICQAQSLNLFFPPKSDRAYVNSVHLKFLNSKYVKSLYYYRTEKEGKTDNVKTVERQALADWNGEECVACQG